jgi:hypothetical protein
MSITVCLTANTLAYPGAGGHLWVYLNWALGLRAVGCEVIWLEGLPARTKPKELPELVRELKTRLKRYGLDGQLCLSSWTDEPLPPEICNDCLGLEQALEADLLLNMSYPIPIVERFRRSALVDIDPGLTQLWMSAGQMKVQPHDLYFTIGETVGQSGSLFPDCGLTWHYTPPPIFLPAWPPQPEPPSTAAYTTVTNWWEGFVEAHGEAYYNGKRFGFLPFLDLPRRTSQPLELAVCLGPKGTDDRLMLKEHGWRVQEAWEVAPTPWEYQRYIQDSLGEFSCVKPSCVRLQNAWISDRTLCYLASGRPAVVQHTGKSRFLPDREGLHRFENIDEARQCLETVAGDYTHQGESARALAEEHFDAQKVLRRVLETALG